VSLSNRVALIEPKQLAERLAEEDLLLLHVSAADRYIEAHIPGAVLVTPADLVCGVPPATGRLPEKAALDALFSRIGYSPTSQIVVYDDEGGGWAGRMAWTLDVIGHDGWTYLNGGIHAWHHAGLPLDTGPQPKRAAAQVDVSIDPTPIAEIPDVLEAIDDPQQVIWDARSAEEFAGLRQTATRVGHMPGAINLDWLDVQDRAQECRVVDDLAGVLEQRGIAGKGAIITHCHTHHRSGLTYMLGRLQGLDIRAYHGSWSEWGNRDDTPIELPA